MSTAPDTRTLYLRDGYAHLGHLPNRTVVDDLTAEATRLYDQPPTRRELLTHPGTTALTMERMDAVERRSQVFAQVLTDQALVDTAAVFLGVGRARPAGATLLCAPPRSPSPRLARLPRPDEDHHRTTSARDDDLVHLWIPLPAQTLRVAFLSHLDPPPLLPLARLREALRRQAAGCGACDGDGFAVHPRLRVAMDENPGPDLRFGAVLTYRPSPEGHPLTTTAEVHR
ncbi:hypothetical protein [Embleya sp. NPDC059237]|uniref:hypothetical protein n=1 Tax=Embleya sp. NPDC059237 TaxID=3346784 RepID=UPI0036CC4D0A